MNENSELCGCFWLLGFAMNDSPLPTHLLYIYYMYQLYGDIYIHNSLLLSSPSLSSFACDFFFRVSIHIYFTVGALVLWPRKSRMIRHHF